ncbi:hypothetical protein [Asanoa iriomotensis]|uniref:hypothetical protein n=1 Tax=Asanoa iriomotensis TaxID=234613 RepID=UPI0019450E19|nr:hypothetical protein [Asanoa iriomotensis]
MTPAARDSAAPGVGRPALGYELNLRRRDGGVHAEQRQHRVARAGDRMVQSDRLRSGVATHIGQVGFFPGHPGKTAHEPGTEPAAGARQQVRVGLGVWRGRHVQVAVPPYRREGGRVRGIVRGEEPRARAVAQPQHRDEEMGRPGERDLAGAGLGQRVADPGPHRRRPSRTVGPGHDVGCPDHRERPRLPADLPLHLAQRRRHLGVRRGVRAVLTGDVAQRRVPAQPDLPQARALLLVDEQGWRPDLRQHVDGPDHADAAADRRRVGAEQRVVHPGADTDPSSIAHRRLRTTR